MLQTLQILKNSSIGSCRSAVWFLGWVERMAEECKRSELSLILNNVVSCLKQGVLPGTQPARNTSTAASLAIQHHEFCCDSFRMGSGARSNDALRTGRICGHARGRRGVSYLS